MDTGLEGAPEAPDSAVGRGASGSSFVLEGPCGGSACSCLLASPRTGTPPRQPPLPEGPGERIPCRSSDLRAESGGRRGAEPGPLAAGDSEVLKSWTHLVHAWGRHCTQWTPLLTALCPQPQQGGGLYAEPAGCQMGAQGPRLCSASCAQSPSHSGLQLGCCPVSALVTWPWDGAAWPSASLSADPRPRVFCLERR